MPRMGERQRTLLRSQSGPAAGMSVVAVPSNSLFRKDAQLFRVSLLRRLRLPLPPSSRMCRCGRLLDSFGRHRAVSGRLGDLQWNICREAGGRVALLVRDLAFHFPFTTPVAWKLSWTASRCSEGCSWRLTPHSSQRCIATGHPTEARQSGMRWSWKQHAGAKRGPIPNLFVQSQGEACCCGRQMVPGGGVFHQESCQGQCLDRTAHPQEEDPTRMTLAMGHTVAYAVTTGPRAHAGDTPSVQHVLNGFAA